MSENTENVWQGICRDCFKRDLPLIRFTDFNLMNPPADDIYLCQKCIDDRRFDDSEGLPIRPIGLPAESNGKSEWTDLPQITVASLDGVARPEIIVKIKLRIPTIPEPMPTDGGEVHMQIGDNPYWERCERLNCARHSVESMTHQARTGVCLNLNNLFAKHGMRARL